MNIETLGDAQRAGWKAAAQCLGRDARIKKGSRPCPQKIEFDMPTLIWTRGKDFPLAMLAERLKCPSCNCRRMLVYFSKPGTSGFATMAS